MTDTAELLIQRGDRWDRFKLAFQPGQSVLDGVRQVRATQDPSLAIRHACINANACKECMILIDGKVAYACTTRLQAGEMRLQPLPNKPLVQDLVTEIAATDERLESPKERAESAGS